MWRARAGGARLAALSPAASELWLKWGRFGKGVLPFWVADMDFRAPERVTEALRRHLERGGPLGYAMPPPGLQADVLRHLEERYGWDRALLPQKEEDLLFFPSIVAVMNAVCRMQQQAGAAMMCTPCFPPVMAAPGNAGIEAVAVPMLRPDGAGNGWTLDFDAMEETMRRREREGKTPAKTFFLVNPVNPVSRVLAREELERLAAFCLRHDMIICSDEVHSDLVLDPQERRHISIASLDRDIAARSITLNGPCKAFNFGGVSIAFAVVPDPTLRERLGAACAGGVVGDVGPLQYAAMAAVYSSSRQEGQGESPYEHWLPQLLETLRGNRAMLYEAIEELAPLGVSVAPMEGTYLAWIDVGALFPRSGTSAATRAEEEEGVDTTQYFLEHARLAFTSGADYSAPAFVRMNIACPPHRLKEGLRRFAAAVRDRANR